MKLVVTVTVPMNADDKLILMPMSGAPNIGLYLTYSQ